MPPSSCYGHDAQGINIHNLRSLNAPSAKELPGGFRTESDWKREAHEAVVSAENVNQMSRTLREASRRLEENLKRKVKTDESVTEAALRNRIQKTTALKNLVERAIDNTDLEKNNLQVSLKKLQDRAKNIRRKMDLTDGRVRHRCDRPQRETVNDAVQLQLKKESLLLQSYLSEIESKAKTANCNIQRIERIRQRLRNDLDAKMKAIEIDRQVLEDDVNDRKLLAEDNASAAAMQPHQWSRNTENVIKEANSLTRETERFRQESSAMLKGNEMKRKDISAVLNKSMLDKLNETEGLKCQLESKLDEILKEIEEAKHRRDTLEESLDSKKQPMERAAKRLSLRALRPTVERVDDEAHRALIGELQQITSATQTLKSKITAVNRKIRQLEQQRDALRENIRDKERSWKVDEGCVMLDGRVALSHPPMSVWSSASSVRSLGSQCSGASRVTSRSSQGSDILGRISKLEEEVAMARNERIALEEKVADLTS